MCGSDDEVRGKGCGCVGMYIELKIRIEKGLWVYEIDNGDRERVVGMWG